VQQDYRAAIRYAQELLKIDPLNEATYSQLMDLYAQLGDRSRALRIYHRCLTVLREELGINPSAAIRERYEYLLKLDELSAPISTPQEATEKTVADRTTDRLRQDWGEALDVSVFYGRETELAERV
jgi:DNA-binding SARP family transcriptional activator